MRIYREKLVACFDQKKSNEIIIEYNSSNSKFYSVEISYHFNATKNISKMNNQTKTIEYFWLSHFASNKHKSKAKNIEFGLKSCYIFNKTSKKRLKSKLFSSTGH